MDGPTIDRLERLVLHQKQTIIQPTEPYLLREADGNYILMEPQLKRLELTVYDMNTLAALAKGDGDKVVLVSESAVVLVNEFENVRYEHTLRLPTHPVFQMIKSWQDTASCEQKSLVRTLRSKLASFVDPSIAAKFEKIKITTNGDTERTVGKGVDAIGKNLEQKAMFGNDKPLEIFIVATPVYDVPELLQYTAQITVLVDFEMEPFKILLTSVYGDLARAQNDALTNIIEILKGKITVPIYRASI